MEKRKIKVFWDKESDALPICFCYELPDRFDSEICQGSIVEVTPLHSGTDDEVGILMMMHPDLPLKRIKSLIESSYPAWDDIVSLIEKTEEGFYWPYILEPSGRIDLERLIESLESSKKALQYL